MDYELAKELKEEGFPKENFRVVSEDHPAVKKGSIYPGQENAPTLSELIEACGRDFCLLLQMPSGYLWKAMSNINDNAARGATPEEAVARLWLALNTKL